MEQEDPPVRPPYAPTPHLPRAETASRLANLGALIDYARQRHGVEFTTYGAVTDAVPIDPLFLSRAQVEKAARRLEARLSFVRVDGLCLSLAEVFAAVVWALLHPQARRIPLRHPLGPARLPGEVVAGGELTDEAVRNACAAVEDDLALLDRVPDAVEVGGRRAAPGAFLRAAGGILLGRSSVELGEGPIFPEGFDGTLSRWDAVTHDLLAYFPRRHRPVPNTQLAIKLQYWSYKPVEAV